MQRDSATCTAVERPREPTPTITTLTAVPWPRHRSQNRPVVSVGEHMTRSLLTISADATLGEAAVKMTERAVGAVVVLEGEGIAAILTERDVMRAVPAGRDGSELVSEWMTRHPDTIEPTDTMDHAASLMIHSGFRHLPVVEAMTEVLAIVSIRDLMRVVLDDRSPRGV
jgi:CBS domain-containing protein